MEDKLQKDLNEFRALCKVLGKVCLRYKDKFTNNNHTIVYDRGPFTVSIYFANNWKTWQISAGELIYLDFANSFSIPNCAIDDMQYTMELNRTLQYAIDSLSNKRRKLKF